MMDANSEIEVITREEVIKAAPARWAEQYKGYEDKPSIEGKTKAAITKELSGLAPHELTASRVNKVIGNESWTKLECDSCGENVRAAAQMVRDTEWDCWKVCICLPCLRLAADAIGKAMSGEEA